MCIEKFFDGFFTDSDISVCKNLVNGNVHPLMYYFTQDVCDSSNCFNYTKNNIVSSYKAVMANDKDWLHKNKNRLIDEDISNATSAIGELRCYGVLLSAFGADNVKPIPESKYKTTPDFYVCNEYNEKIFIEVNTVQTNGDEFKKLTDFNSVEKTKLHQNIVVCERCIAPFGRKNADCITENVIHKLCQIKQNENQFDDKNTSLLWVDLQDHNVNLLYNRAMSSCPIMTYNGMLFSNEFWYSLYGEKGFPVFEGYYINDFRRISTMKHSGRFHSNNNSKIDAVIFSLPNSIVIYENPNSKNPIPRWFLENLFSISCFNYQGSKINYPSNNLLKQLEIDKNNINSFAKSEDLN